MPSVVVINWKLMTGSQEGVGQGRTGATAGICAFGVFFGLLLSLAIPIVEVDHEKRRGLCFLLAKMLAWARLLVPWLLSFLV